MSPRRKKVAEGISVISTLKAAMFRDLPGRAAAVNETADRNGAKLNAHADKSQTKRSVDTLKASASFLIWDLLNDRFPDKTSDAIPLDPRSFARAACVIPLAAMSSFKASKGAGASIG